MASECGLRTLDETLAESIRLSLCAEKHNYRLPLAGVCTDPVQTSELGTATPEAPAVGELGSMAAALARIFERPDLNIGLYCHAGPGRAGHHFLRSGVEAAKRKRGRW